MNATIAPSRPSTNSPGQRFTFHCGNWRDYQRFLDTYKEPTLEVTTLSFEHESWSSLLGRLIELLTFELDLPMQSGGSTTFGREDLDRGLEPDQCYYLENEPVVRGKDAIDLAVDPPPDLALDIEMSRSALDRLGICAAIGAPEVWRFDGSMLRVHRLDHEGQYHEVARSGHFPFLPLVEFQAFLLRRGQLSETALLRSFQQWTRNQMARNWQKEEAQE